MKTRILRIRRMKELKLFWPLKWQNRITLRRTNLLVGNVKRMNLLRRKDKGKIRACFVAKSRWTIACTNRNKMIRYAIWPIVTQRQAIRYHPRFGGNLT